MLKKNKYILTLGSLVLPTSLFFVSSCSIDTSIQNEANQIYKQIWANVNNKDLAIDASTYANSIYDFNSFKTMTKSNEIKNIPNNLFNVILNNFNYEYSGEGMLQFEVLLQSKKDNKVYYPIINQDENVDFFSNIIRINGFKKMDKKTKDKLDNIYNTINQSKFEFNQLGIELILNNNVNIESNINFSDLNNQNYIKKYINIPAAIINSEFDIWGFKTDLFEINDIVVDKTSDEISFNFWIIVALKNNPNKPLAINFGLNNNNGFTNNLKTINISYKPNFIFNIDINNIDQSLANESKENIKKTITSDWIVANKNKLFKSSSLAIIDSSKIKNINITFDKKSINLSFDFVINNSLSYNVSHDIYGFNLLT